MSNGVFGLGQPVLLSTLDSLYTLFINTVAKHRYHGLEIRRWDLPAFFICVLYTNSCGKGLKIAWQMKTFHQNFLISS
jgi:hypothetical protein